MKQRKFRVASLITAVLGVFLVPGCWLHAQTLEPSDSASGISTLRVSTSLVMIDAVITDRHTQKPIGGLTPNDFLLLEDDVPQVILHADTGRTPLSIIFMIDLTKTVSSVRQSLGKAADEILGHLDQRDEVAVAVFSSSAQIVLPFTIDRTKAAEALARASRMSSDETTFINESLYGVLSQIVPTASAGSRTAIICLTDGTTGIPSDHEKDIEAPSMAKVTLHTEQEATNALLTSGAIVNAVIEKSTLTYLYEASRHASSDDVRRFPPGNVKDYAKLSGGIAIRSGKADSTKALATLLDDLRARYTLSYRPSEAAPTGALRHVKVTINPNVIVGLEAVSVHAKERYLR